MNVSVHEFVRKLVKLTLRCPMFPKWVKY